MMDANNKTVVVIGAGPAGLTAASELASHGWKVRVLEKDGQYVGGLSRTVDRGSMRFDLGSHRFFTKNPEIGQWWEQRLPEDFLRIKRHTRIIYRGRFLDYPLRPANALGHMGAMSGAACVFGSLRRKFSPIQPETSFEDWVINRFGDRLYHEFFKSYTEKVWGMPCSKISADWAGQRIKGLSLKMAIKNAFGMGVENGAKTLAEEFRYPRMGAGMMWEKTRADLERQGVAISMGEEVVSLRRSGSRILEITTRNNGELKRWSADAFISSMPLRDCILATNPSLDENTQAAARRLTYRNLIVVALKIRRNNTLPDHWIYVHDPRVKVGRIQILNNWGQDLVTEAGVTCLSLDYFCSDGGSLWTMDEQELARLAEQEIKLLGLIQDGRIEECQIVKTRQAYPVYALHYREDVGTIRKALAQFDNFQVIGRNGMHKYNNQDHSMLAGILAARNLNGGRFDLWKVNSDAEYLEEST